MRTVPVDIRERRLAFGDVYGREIPPPGGQVNDTRIFFSNEMRKNEMKEEKKHFL